MKNIRTISLVASLFIFSTNAVIAAEVIDPKAFDGQIFSLSKKKENAFDAPSATYVLGSEEIRRSGSTSIPEALRLVPGLQVAKIDGHKWAISARGFNNQFSNKLLVMIDGRIIYTPVFSGVIWDSQDYVMEDIDRIEVVRGPGGTIWGANAVNGVINIITKNAAQTQGSYVSQIVGNQDKSITEVRYGGETANRDSYRLYAKSAVRDGVDKYSTHSYDKDGNKQNRAGFRYDISSIKDSTISIHGDIFSGKADNYFNSGFVGGSNDKQSNGGNMVLNWDKKLSAKSNFTLNAYFDYDQFKLPVFSRSARTYDIDFQHFYNFSKQNQFMWGVGYRRVDDNINENPLASGVIPFNYTPNNLNSYVYNGFIQDKIGIIADELYLTIGSKFINNNFTGFEYMPNAKLAYYPTRNQTIWASVSRAVRTPTRNEDGVSINVPVAGFQSGNNHYRSEDLIAYELGYRIKPTNKTSIDVSTFFNDYSSLRTFERVGANQYTAANQGSGESYGFEISSKWQVNEDWKLEASYDYLKTTLHINPGSTDNTNSSSALQLLEGRTPQSQFKLKSFYNITPKIEFDNFLYYVSGLPTGGTNTYNASTSTMMSGTGIPSYFRFDTRLGYLPTKHLDLSIGIQNLFNQIHSEFNAATFANRTEIGRTFYAKVVWQY
jgi:iron complex outermembrane receptor protein